ncbi:MAG: outer membrane beta-barrel protein [Gammaproteobacteria bacterium]|nr:outer membrane beta-barrel protein [Gammaproteobacteria bacterium]
MKKIFKISSLILLSLTTSNMALATQRGIYGDLGLGLGFGPSNTIVKSDYFINSDGTLSANTSDLYTLNTRGVTTGFVNLGYNFIPYFGAEVDVTYWGKQNLTSFVSSLTTQSGEWDGNLQSYSYGLNGVGYLPLDDKINLFAKLGFAMLNSKLTVNDPTGSIFFNPGSYRMTSNEPSLVYGAGALYQINKYLAGELEWKGLNRFSDSRISNINYNLISIALRFTFK